MIKKSAANRGMNLERLVEKTNNFYKKMGMALVQKVPTPTKNVGRERNGMPKLVYQKGEWVDFLGLWNGKAITFDTKEIALESFPFTKLHDHQFEFMKEWSYFGGKAFLIIHFTKHDEYYMLPYDVLKDYWEEAKANKGKRGTQSISYKACQYDAVKIEKKDGRLYYLDALEKYYN